MARTRLRCGWTIQELILATGLMVFLLGLLAPALPSLREQANRTHCRAHLKNLGLAVQQYHGIHGHLPPYASGRPGEIHGSWLVHLLPQLGQEGLFQQLHAQLQVSGNKAVLESGRRGERNEIFPFLICPSDPTTQEMKEWGKTSYLGNWFALTDGSQGTYTPPRRLQSYSDGPATVVLFAEAYAVCDRLARVALESSQYHNFGVTPEGKASDDPSYLPEDFTFFQVRPRPGSNPCHKWRTQSPHSVMQVTMADASVRSIKPDISPRNWKHGLKPCDGFPLSED